MSSTNPSALSRISLFASGLSAIRSAIFGGIGRQLSSPFSGGFFSMPSSGVNVTPDTALQCTAVWACVGVISRTIGTVPCVVEKRDKTGSGWEDAFEHPLYSILSCAPNEAMTSTELRETMQGHALLRGNGYGRLKRDQAGQVRELDHMHSDAVGVYKKESRLAYTFSNPEGGQETLPASEVLHVRGLSPDGIIGYSPIALARESIGLALAAEQHGGALFGNGARPGGVIELAGAIGKQQRDDFRADWNEIHQGSKNGSKVAILPYGMKYSTIGMTNEDAQFLQTRKYQVVDIARLFNVPPHKIAELERATFSNIEQQSIEFVSDCIAPWGTRWEQRMNHTLLTPTERKNYRIKLRLVELLKGDLKSRYEAYAIGVNAGWLSPNDVRKAEGLSPIEGGDEYRMPLNMQRLSDLGAPGSGDAPVDASQISDMLSAPTTKKKGATT